MFRQKYCHHQGLSTGGQVHSNMDILNSHAQTFSAPQLPASSNRLLRPMTVAAFTVIVIAVITIITRFGRAMCLALDVVLGKGQITQYAFMSLCIF
jgi:hypothetical protein